VISAGEVVLNIALFKWRIKVALEKQAKKA